MDQEPASIRLLIVEDDPEWQETLEDNFKFEAEEQNFKFEIHISPTIGEAKSALRTRQYHALSIDQNMPDAKGGDVTADHGRQFMEGVSKAGIPVFAAMYTAYPDTENANAIGRATGIEYKTKSTETNTDINALEPEDYVKWFLETFKKSYLKKVLKRVAVSAYQNLAEYSRLASDEHDRAIESRQDEDMTRFLSRLNSVREELLRNLIALTRGLMSNAGLKIPKAPNLQQAHSVENWLKKHWDQLEENEDFVAWKNFMGISDDYTMSQHFLNPTMELRLERNRVEHDKKIDYSYETYLKLYPAIIRMADILTYFVTRRMINRPSLIRPGILSYVELRGTYSETSEILYSHQPPDDEDNNKVFTQLMDDGPLIALAPGFSVKRDDKERLQLVCDIG